MEQRVQLGDALMDENELADYLGITANKLQRDRWAGTGLPYIKIGRCVRYRRSDVEAYLASHTVTPRWHNTGIANSPY